MKIRLNPDHLGEIHVRVSAGGKSGSEVGLQIQASDERAKRILEESISSLKDGLASQSLTLSKIDVQVAQPQARNAAEFQTSLDQRGAQAQLQNGDAGAGEGRQSRRDAEGAELGTLRTAQRGRTAWAPAAATSRSAAGSGRLDVMA